RLTSSHTGEYLANKVFECLETYGVSLKILGNTTDNASNNNTYVSTLETLLPDEALVGTHTHVRCF
ncbi:hypothetical protein K435DRAFT_560036, partial [Dendrothele bispora CBS 962.96]